MGTHVTFVSTVFYVGGGTNQKDASLSVLKRMFGAKIYLMSMEVMVCKLCTFTSQRLNDVRNQKQTKKMN